jgi:hypothetical protein
LKAELKKKPGCYVKAEIKQKAIAKTETLITINIKR